MRELAGIWLGTKTRARWEAVDGFRLPPKLCTDWGALFCTLFAFRWPFRYDSNMCPGEIPGPSITPRFLGLFELAHTGQKRSLPVRPAPGSPQSGAGRGGGRRGKNGKNQQKHYEGARRCGQARISAARGSWLAEAGEVRQVRRDRRFDHEIRRGHAPCGPDGARNRCVAARAGQDQDRGRYCLWRPPEGSDGCRR